MTPAFGFAMSWAERNQAAEDAAAVVFFSAGLLSLCAIALAALVSELRRRGKMKEE